MEFAKEPSAEVDSQGGGQEPPGSEAHGSERVIPETSNEKRAACTIPPPVSIL